ATALPGSPLIRARGAAGLVLRRNTAPSERDGPACLWASRGARHRAGVPRPARLAGANGTWPRQAAQSNRTPLWTWASRPAALPAPALVRPANLPGTNGA